jgi:hypothetical protein
MTKVDLNSTLYYGLLPYFTCIITVVRRETDIQHNRICMVRSQMFWSSNWLFAILLQFSGLHCKFQMLRGFYITIQDYLTTWDHNVTGCTHYTYTATGSLEAHPHFVLSVRMKGGYYATRKCAAIIHNFNCVFKFWTVYSHLYVAHWQIKC